MGQKEGGLVTELIPAQGSKSPKGAEARKQEILTLLKSEGFHSTVDLASEFGVSDMTIRRDISDLEEEGLVRRVHGGVSSISNRALAPTDFRERTHLNFEKKIAIAREAVKFIARGDIAAFDAGSTTLEIARLLPTSSNVSVVTHSLPVINELTLNTKIKIHAIGGELHFPTQSFSSLDSANQLSEFRFTTFFLSVGSIRDGAVFCATPYEAVMKKAFIESSERIILVSDSTKFTSSAMVKVCELSKIDVLITDDQVSNEIKNLLDGYANLELVIATSALENLGV